MAYHPERPHPIRFIEYFDFAKGLQREFRPGGKYGRHMTQAMFDEISRAVQTDYNNRLNAIPREGRPKRPLPLITNVLTMACAVGGFTHAGRNIFQISDALVEMLLNTDPGDVRVNDLRMPYDHFYIFMPRLNDERFRLHGAPNRIDGVYINATTPGHWQIYVTAHLTAEPLAYPANIEPYFFASVPIDDKERTIASLLQEFLVSEEKSKREIAAATESAVENLARAEDAPIIVSVAAKGSEETIRNMGTSFDPARKAIDLAFAAIIYLNAIGDVSVEYPADAPRDLVAKATESHPTRQRKAAAELLSRGFSAVRIIGRSNFPLHEPTSSEVSARLVTPHWRRGHFRRQAHGEGLAQRKIVWIRPVIVSKESLGEDLPRGHIYRIEE